MAKFRRKVGKSKSRKSFRKSSGFHPKNSGRVMRGGIRL
jgi:hypothetical protein